MGVFSWNCECCGQSIKGPFDGSRSTPPEAIAWQNEVVALLPDGTRLRGYYDGYGRVNADPSPWPLDLEGDSLLVQKTGPWDYTQRKQEGDPAVWHAKCYAHAGSPTEYPGPSHPADDQGHFYSLPEEVARAEKFWNETPTYLVVWFDEDGWYSTDLRPPTAGGAEELWIANAWKDADYCGPFETRQQALDALPTTTTQE